MARKKTFEAPLLVEVKLRSGETLELGALTYRQEGGFLYVQGLSDVTLVNMADMITARIEGQPFQLSPQIYAPQPVQMAPAQPTGPQLAGAAAVARSKPMLRSKQTPSGPVSEVVDENGNKSVVAAHFGEIG